MNPTSSPQSRPDASPLVRMDDPGLWDRAKDVLDRGQCVVFPTDTVYGIAASPDNPIAVARLQQVKGRSDAFPPPVLVADAEDAWSLALSVPVEARRLGEAFWPGALTLVLPTDRHLSLAGQTGTIGVRVPDHDGVRGLLRFVGPLAVSSANKHERPPATTVAEAMGQLGDEVGLYIDGGPTPGPSPSTVVDCSGPAMAVLRLGLLSKHQIFAAAGAADA